MQWFERAHPELRIFAIPNGGKRGKLEAMRLRLEGTSPGVPIDAQPAATSPGVRPVASARAAARHANEPTRAHHLSASVVTH